jgi:hypothetical protein
MNAPPDPLPVRRAKDLDAQPPENAWMIRSLWGRSAVGILGGCPKVGKSWLGLDMAISVASGTPCLDHFPVEKTGRTLIYLAEDSPSMVRSRIESLCAHRRLSIDALDLHVITSPVLRLDLPRDQMRLRTTLAGLKPTLLLLDPLIRMHRLDENSSADVSTLLSFLRELQRTFDVAVVLVHHASKKHRAQPGQALRGSSDLHAFGDSNAYLTWRQDHVLLTLEHRAAPAPDPVVLRLACDAEGTRTHLALCSSNGAAKRCASLVEDVLRLLRQADGPLRRAALRSSLRVSNERLGDALRSLQDRRLARQTPRGWILLRTDLDPGAGASCSP